MVHWKNGYDANTILMFDKKQLLPLNYYLSPNIYKLRCKRTKIKRKEKKLPIIISV